MSSSWPSRSISSYCTDGGCPPSAVAAASASLNAFSITSYYVSLDGLFTPCSSSYGACNWTAGTGSVERSNADLQQSSGLLAQPLVFSNSGDMVRAFRALLNRPDDGINLAASFLRLQAASYGYRRVQLDLEPSCWADNASACDWPKQADAIGYVRLINATSDALASIGAELTVAVGTWPKGQCSPEQYANCTASADTWADACEAGDWNVHLCNCCAYANPFGFFHLSELCGSRASRIINMDTYQNAPVNLSDFSEAVVYYNEHGCSMEKLSIGLLSGEATSPDDARDIMELVDDLGATELDVWANLWAQPKELSNWQDAFTLYLDGGAATKWLTHPQPAILIAVGFVLFLCAGFCVWRRARRRKQETSDRTAALLASAVGDGGDAALRSSTASAMPLSRRASSRAVLERATSTASNLAPSLVSIGNNAGGFGSGLFGSGAIGPGGVAAFASEPALASAASMVVQSKVSLIIPEDFGGMASSARPTAATEESGIAEEEGDETAAAASRSLYSWNLRVLPLFHFLVGISNNIQGVAWREYLLHGADGGKGLQPADQALLSGVICSLPWNLKIIVAFISDAFPICGGLRRLPWLIIGLALQGGGWLLLGFLDTNANLPIIAAQQFFVTFGQMVTGVMCDSLVVENARMEVESSEIGKLQTSTQIAFAAGGLAGTALAGVLPQFAGLSSAAIFDVRGCGVALLVLYTLLLLRERPPLRKRSSGAAAEEGGGGTVDDATPSRTCWASAKETASGVWRTAQLPTVVMPLLFIFAFAAAPNNSDAFNSYLLQQKPAMRRQLEQRNM